MRQIVVVVVVDVVVVDVVVVVVVDVVVAIGVVGDDNTFLILDGSFRVI